MGDKNKPYRFPEQLLHQINEHSNGGFILVTIDAEGSPQPFLSFDNGVNALGLISFVKNWSEGLDCAQGNSIANSFFDSDEDDDDGADNRKDA